MGGGSTERGGGRAASEAAAAASEVAKAAGGHWRVLRPSLAAAAVDQTRTSSDVLRRVYPDLFRIILLLAAGCWLEKRNDLVRARSGQRSVGMYVT